MRTDYDIDDETFFKIVEPHDKAVRNYIKNNMLYDYLAFYLASGYELNTLWASSLRGHINSAIEDFCAIEYKNKCDYKKINKILKEKYNLVITNYDPLEMKKR